MSRGWIIVGTCVAIISAAVGFFFISNALRAQAKAGPKPPVTIHKTEIEVQEQKLQSAVIGGNGRLVERVYSSAGWTVGVEVKDAGADTGRTLHQVMMLMMEIHRTAIPIDRITVVFRTNKFKDVYGHVLPDVATARVSLSGATLDRIDWNGFDQANLPRVADEFWLHDLLMSQPLATEEASFSGGGGGGGGGGKGGGASAGGM